MKYPNYEMFLPKEEVFTLTIQDEDRVCLNTCIDSLVGEFITEHEEFKDLKWKKECKGSTWEITFCVAAEKPVFLKVNPEENIGQNH